MNRITANLLTELFNGSAADRTILSKEIFINVDTEAGAEILIRPFSPQIAAEYLTHLIGNTKSSLLEPMILNDSVRAPINVVFNGRYIDTALRKEYNEPLITYRHCPHRKESVLIMDRFYQEQNPSMGQYLQAPSIFQMINALNSAGGRWSDVEFHTQKDEARPSLRLVK